MEKSKYNNLVMSLEIQDIELLSLECSQAIKSRGGKISVHTDFEVKDILESDKQVKVFIAFIVCSYKESVDDSGQAISDLTGEKLFDIKFTYVLSYKKNNDDTYEKEYYEFFAQRNVPLNVWAYARELVSSITTKMGFPTLILPMYKVMPSGEEK